MKGSLVRDLEKGFFGVVSHTEVTFYSKDKQIWSKEWNTLTPSLSAEDTYLLKDRDGITLLLPKEFLRGTIL